MTGFEWDEAKRRTTLAKHHLDFRDVVEVFQADFLELPGRSNVETRRIAVGSVEGVVIAVVFTRRDDAIRIITARKARTDERNEYQAYVNRRDPGPEI